MRKRKLSKSIYLINSFDTRDAASYGGARCGSAGTVPGAGTVPLPRQQVRSSTLLGLLVLYLPYAVVSFIYHIENAG